MTTQASTPLQVATSQARNRIPNDWAVEFNDWSDEALFSLMRDDKVSNQKIKAYATWELDFRNVFGMEVPEPTTTGDRRIWNAAESVKKLMGDLHRERVELEQEKEQWTTTTT